MALLYKVPQNHVVLIERFGAHSRVLLPESKRGIVMLTNGDYGFDIIKKVEADFLLQ